MEKKRFKPDIFLIIAFVAIGMMVCIAVYANIFPERPARFPVSQSPVAFDVTPDGKSVIVAVNGGGLILIDRASGRTIKELPVEQFAPTNPALSPDGKYLAYAATPRYRGDSSLYLWEWQTAKKPVRLTAGGNDSRPAFSPDGKRIAFNRIVPMLTLKMLPPSTPHIINADGTNLSRLTPKEFQSLSVLRFSPKGDSLIFSGYEYIPNSSATTRTSSGLFSLSLNPPNTVREISIPVGTVAYNSDISRDGRRLAFVTDGAERLVYDIYVSGMPPSSASPLHCSAVSKSVEALRFAPDGRRVLFLGVPPNSLDPSAAWGDWQLWEGDASGKKDFRLIYPRPKKTS